MGKVLALSAILLVILVSFQNCQRFEGGTSDPVSSLTKSPMAEAGNGDGYGGKLGTYVLLDQNQFCPLNPTGGARIRSKVEVRADGIYRTYRDCHELTVAERIDESAVYFAELSRVLIIEGDLYVRYAGGLVAAAGDYAYHFCTNRWNASPQIGLELRLVRRVDRENLFRAQVFLKYASGESKAAAFVQVTHELPPSGRFFTAPTDKRVSLSYGEASKLRGQGFSAFRFAASEQDAEVALDDVRCWSAVESTP